MKGKATKEVGPGTGLVKSLRFKVKDSCNEELLEFGINYIDFNPYCCSYWTTIPATQRYSFKKGKTTQNRNKNNAGKNRKNH